ncbi:terminase small subunit [Escherichia coli]
MLSRIAGEIASILDGIPLSVQRRLPYRNRYGYRERADL